MKIRPLDNGVVIKQLEAKEKTAGGIFLPEAAKEKPMIGTVIATGPGKLNDNGTVTAMSVKKGDQVLYSKYMGNEIELEGEKYVILRENDIFGIIEK
jgi:chaperonin GroES